MSVHMSATAGEDRIGPRSRISPDRLNMFNRFDAFESTGGYFGGLQFGYDYMLPNRFVIGGMVDASVPSWPNLNEISIGGISTFVSPTLGQESYTRERAAFRHRARSRRLRTRQLARLRDRWLCLDLRSADADATGQLRHDRFCRFCGASAGPLVRASRCRWRRTGRRALNICTRSTATAAWASPTRRSAFQSDLAVQQLRLGVNYRFGADPTSGSDAAVRTACAGGRPCQCSRADHVRVAGLSEDPVALCGPPQPDRPRRGPRNLGRHAVCRHTTVARRRSVGQPGARSGFRLRRHPRRGRIFQRRILQARLRPTPTRACSARSCGKPSI